MFTTRQLAIACTLVLVAGTAVQAQEGYSPEELAALDAGERASQAMIAAQLAVNTAAHEATRRAACEVQNRARLDATTWSVGVSGSRVAMLEETKSSLGSDLLHTEGVMINASEAKDAASTAAMFDSLSHAQADSKALWGTLAQEAGRNERTAMGAAISVLGAIYGNPVAVAAGAEVAKEGSKPSAPMQTSVTRTGASPKSLSGISSSTGGASPRSLSGQVTRSVSHTSSVARPTGAASPLPIAKSVDWAEAKRTDAKEIDRVDAAIKRAQADLDHELFEFDRADAIMNNCCGVPETGEAVVGALEGMLEALGYSPSDVARERLENGGIGYFIKERLKRD